MHFTALYNEQLSPTIEDMEFRDYASEIFVKRVDGASPDILSAHEHRIVLEGLRLTSYLVRVDSSCTNIFGEIMPNIGAYNDYMPDYFMRTDVFQADTPDASTSGQIIQARVASLRTVLGSAIFETIDTECSTANRLTAERARRSAAHILINPHDGDKQFSIPHFTDEALRTISGLVLGTAERAASRRAYLAAELIINNQSALWQETTAAHQDAKAKSMRSIHPDAPADPALLLEFMRRKNRVFDVGIALRTKNDTCRLVMQALHIPAEQGVEQTSNEIDHPIPIRMHSSQQLKAWFEFVFGASVGRPDLST